MKKSKTIEFICHAKGMETIYPNPKPAKVFIPEPYKKLERFYQNDMKSGTLKTCVPFMDAMFSGYVIPFDQDYLINPTEKDFSIVPSDPNHTPEYHDKKQVPPEWHNKIGEQAGKFFNQWLILTPPGYSCLFVHPMNRMEDRWEMLSGVVDTDVYKSLIHFPFILNKRDKQFLIKKGEPMVQVIPFKRESWKMWSGFYYEKKHRQTLNLLLSEWVDKYKKFFWNKKSFK